MKNLILLFAILLIAVPSFSQQQFNVHIDPGQNVNEQHIGIHTAGRELFSFQKAKPTKWNTKGRFSSVPLDEFLDAIEQQLNINGEINGFAEFADTTFSTIEYVDSVFATIEYVDSTFTLPYDEYVIVLSQSGTSAPTAFVLDDFENMDVVWTRDDVGTYKGVCTPPMSLSYVYFAQPSTSASTVGFTTQIGQAFGGDIYLFTLNPAGTEVDFDGEVYIMVREYNP